MNCTAMFLPAVKIKCGYKNKTHESPEEREAIRELNISQPMVISLP